MVNRFRVGLVAIGALLSVAWIYTWMSAGYLEVNSSGNVVGIVWPDSYETWLLAFRLLATIGATIVVDRWAFWRAG